MSLLWCPPGAAQVNGQDAAVQALTIYKDGLELYRAGKTTQALARFLAAQAKSDHRNHLHFISRCHKDLRQLRKAHEYFIKYVQHLPAANQPVQLQQAEQKLRREPLCAVSIWSNPAGATVLVDGKQRGITPKSSGLVLLLPGGKPKIELRLEGHQGGHWAPNLEYGEPQEKRLSLRPWPAILRISSGVPGTRIWLSGKSMGVAPLQRELPAGRHLVQARADGYQARSQWLTLAPGETRDLRLELQPNSRPAPAVSPANEVFFDLAFGPAQLDYGDPDLPAGWTVQLSASGGYVWRLGSWGLYARGSLHYTAALDLANGDSSGAYIMGLAGGGGRLYIRPSLWVDAGLSVGVSVLVGVSKESMLFGRIQQNPKAGQPLFELPGDHEGLGYASLAINARTGLGFVVGPGITVALYPFTVDLCLPNEHFRYSVEVILRYNVAVAVGWQW